MWWLWVLLIVLAVIVGLMLMAKLIIVLTMGKCTCPDDMTGKTVIVTGANGGIGKETARELARRNARVILACRNMERGNDAASEIIATTGNRNVIMKQLDLSSMKSVRDFAADIYKTESRLDILINNAAAVTSSSTDRTEEGLEVQFATNHFGPFLLTNLLLDLLKKSAPSRIIVVSSAAHYFGTLDLQNLNCERSPRSPLAIYCSTKFANILFTRELSRRLKGTGVTANSLHPGVVRTQLFQNAKFLQNLFYRLLGTYAKNAFQGAQTSIHLAVSKDLKDVSGKYFADCKPFFISFRARSMTKARLLWEKSEIITKLKTSGETAIPVSS